MKHIKTMTLPKKACGTLQSIFVGLIAQDDAEYNSICRDKQNAKE